MNPTKFEYYNKDIGMLRRDIAFRLTFMFLFFLAFASQLLTFIYFRIYLQMNVVMLAVGISIMVMSLIIVAICLAFSFKNLKTINTIKKNGSCVSSVAIFMSVKKDSFLKLYYIISSIIAYLVLAAFFGLTTYSILNFIYNDVVTFYLPFLFFATLTSFHTMFHLRYEIKVLTSVQKYNSVF